MPMPQSLRVVFMGTPAFALPALEALHQAGYTIAAVYTQPPRPAGRGQKETPSPVHAYALAHGLPVFTPASLKSPETQAAFAAHHADIAVVVAYGLLLPKPILDAPRLGCINIHPSLLPRWRGAAPIQRTLMAGDRETAVCIMQMSEGLDEGDVLLTERLAIPADMNAGTLHDTLAVMGARLTVAALEALGNGKVKAAPQSTQGVTYAKKIAKADGRIDWSHSADAIANQVRALSPAPGAYFDYKGETIKVFSAAVENGNGAPGTALDNQLLIACGKGALRLLELQRPGKKRMAASEWLKGLPLPAGCLLV